MKILKPNKLSVRIDKPDFKETNIPRRECKIKAKRMSLNQLKRLFVKNPALKDSTISLYKKFATYDSFKNTYSEEY